MKMKPNIFKLILVLMLGGCKQNYDPPAVTTDLNILVVDGFLNNDNSGTTNIRLSRTKKINEGVDNAGEVNAQLTVEDVNGNPVYYFSETGDGNYAISGLSLDINSKYRLRIATSDGKHYLSDEITVKYTPPIDSVSWQRLDNGVMIYANTHDPLGQTKYYRWDYTETYDYFSYYFSSIIYDNGIVRNRQPDEAVYECWTSNNSTNLLLASSAKLSTDIISLAPLRFIPANSIEISSKYSIFLRQYALTKDCFDYYQNLKKISEQLGSIFDAQPSQLSGNMHCLENPGETILGFVAASSLETKRIFISHEQVAPWSYALFCDYKIKVTPDSVDYYFGYGAYVPTDAIIGPPFGTVVAYNAGTRTCVDCRSRGGTNVRPDFWP